MTKIKTLCFGFMDVDIGLPVKDGDYDVKFSDGELGVSRFNIRMLRKPIRFLPLAHDYWSMEVHGGKVVESWRPHHAHVNRKGSGTS